MEPPVPVTRLTPRFIGKRFKHTIPVELLSDLKTYCDLVREIAKGLYKKDNPEKHRVPKAFTNAFRFSLYDIEGGSAVANLVETYEEDVESEIIDARKYFLQAKSLVEETVRAGKDADGSPPEEFPLRFLSSFEKIGRHLEADEKIDFGHGTKESAPYGAEVRSNLISWVKADTESEISIVGRVTGITSDPQDEFDLRLPQGLTISGPYDPVQEPTVIEAFQKRLTHALRTVGTGVFDVRKRLIRVSKVKRVDLLDRDQLALHTTLERLDHFLRLDQGWDGGDGLPLTKDAVTWGRQILTKFSEAKIQLPSVYPTPYGEIQMEWQTEDGAVDIRFAVKEKRAAYAVLSADLDSETDLPMATDADFQHLISLLKEKF